MRGLNTLNMPIEPSVRVLSRDIPTREPHTLANLSIYEKNGERWAVLGIENERYEERATVLFETQDELQAFSATIHQVVADMARGKVAKL